MAGQGSDFRRELGQQLRVDSIRCSAAAGSGHPTSSMSAADLMAVLIDGHLRLDYTDPKNPGNDHLIFSKGHASPLYYSVLKAVGAIDDEELLTRSVDKVPGSFVISLVAEKLCVVAVEESCAVELVKFQLGGWTSVA